VIGLDTNILVRYLVQDDPVQSPKATACIESFTPERRGYISLTALVELIWVLTSLYDIDKEGLLDVLDNLLRTRTLAIEQPNTVWRAVNLFRSARADFEDCLIVCSCQAAECDETLTFDAVAAKTAGMRLLR
jgi:predicted nucleic-acid-binding protein